jgi:tubby-related protein 1
VSTLDDEQKAAVAQTMSRNPSDLSPRLEKSRSKTRDPDSLSGSAKDILESSGIIAVFDPVPLPGPKFDSNAMRKLLITPVVRGAPFHCYILRSKKSIQMHPVYELFLEEENKFLLAAKKRSKNKTSNYVISMDCKTLEKDNACYMGKVRSNFVGTEFTMFDHGLNPRDAADDAAVVTVRQELGCILYESNILGSRGPRKMTAVIPNVRKDGQRVPFRPLTHSDTLLAKFRADEQSSDFLTLSNKTPKWNERVGAFVLNFNGRVTMASVKNFQLISERDPDNVILQFGRVGRNRFTMDCQYPLCPLQAFGICLSSLDSKLACE